MRDGTYWAEKLRKNEISFEELCTFFKVQINEENPELNALVYTNFAEGATQYDKFANIGATPFAGLPVPLKILGQTKAGWPDTGGSRLFAKEIAKESNHFVSKLESLGLIPVAQSNAPEFGFKNITDPQLFGDSKNPWDVTRSPGGSSGGAAASVASGMFPLAFASDGGGSIRIPASFCGLIGLKPTRGTMPVGPDGWRGWQGASINFALTVSMRDTEQLFYYLRGTETAAPFQAPASEWQHQRAELTQRPLKIAFTTESPVGSQVSEEAKKSVANAVNFLEKMGHQLTEVAYPLDGDKIIRSYYRMNAGETAAMFAAINQGRMVPIAKDDVELMTWAIAKCGEKIASADYINSLSVWDEASAKMDAFHQDYDLFLTPTTAQVAPKIATDLVGSSLKHELNEIEGLNQLAAEDLIYRMFEKSLALSPFTQLANLTGQPAISLPTHVTVEGLPLGIQLMAAKGREDLLLGLGQQIEAQGLLQLPPFYR